MFSFMIHKTQKYYYFCIINFALGEKEEEEFYNARTYVLDKFIFSVIRLLLL